MIINFLIALSLRMGSSSWFHPIQDLPWTLHIFDPKLQLLEEELRESPSSSFASSYCWVLFLFQHISRSKILSPTIFLAFFFLFLSFFLFYCGHSFEQPWLLSRNLDLPMTLLDWTRRPFACPLPTHPPSHHLPGARCPPNWKKRLFDMIQLI